MNKGVECIVFDLDNTLFAGSHLARISLKLWLAEHPEIFIIFCTGRSLTKTLEVIYDPLTPDPDMLICDIGCSVYNCNLAPAESVFNEISLRWPGAKKVLESIPLLKQFDLQSCDMVNRLSFSVSPKDFAANKQKLESLCKKNQLDCIFSHNKFLDILPKGVNKGSTLLKVLGELAIPLDRTFVFGDSENDFSMLACGARSFFLGDVKILEQQQLDKLGHKQYLPGCDGILQALNISVLNDIKTGGKDFLRGLVYHRIPDAYTVKKTHPNGILSGIIPRDSDIPLDFYFAVSDKNDFSRAAKGAGFLLECVFISKKERDLFYHVASRDMLWPIFHDLPQKYRHDEEAWEVFCEVNKKIAHKISEVLTGPAHIWLHDYNLILVPGYLKAMRADIKIGYFHHIPWSSAGMRFFEHRHLVLSSLSYADVIGMHIPFYLQEFWRSYENDYGCFVQKRLPVGFGFVSQGRGLATEDYPAKMVFANSSVRLYPMPMPINLELIKSLLPSKKKLRSTNKKAILFIARLDYAKGAKEFISFLYDFFLVRKYKPKEMLEFNFYLVPTEYGYLESYQEYEKSVHLKYEKLKAGLEKNNRADVVINLYNSGLTGRKLYEVFAASHVLIAPSVRDGLNLITKEYLAVNGLLGEPAVVLASQGAGVTIELEDVVTYCPYSSHDFYTKFSMVLEDWPVFSEESFKRLNNYLFDQDSGKWSVKLFEML